jgi:hypothetical protein
VAAASFVGFLHVASQDPSTKSDISNIFYIADNYIETVHGGLEMETNPPYLMYTHGNDEVRHSAMLLICYLSNLAIMPPTSATHDFRRSRCLQCCCVMV